MKVALVVPGGVDKSGTERVIPCLLALVERVARVHELHVFAMRQEPRPCRWTLLGAQVSNVGRRPLLPRAVAQVVAEHRRAPFDVLHGVWAASGMVAGAAGRLLRRPALVHLTGGDVADVPEVGYGRCRTPAGRAAIRAAAALGGHVTTPSEQMVALARAQGIRAERLTYGVALDKWPVREPVRRAADAEARLLFAASLNAVKDPFTLVRAAAALRARGVRFRLDVLGTDTLGGAVQRLAAELELGDVVHFHGWVPHYKLRGWMERADALLLTSRHEGDPIVALEAAIAGVPTVGTPVGHLVEWAPDAAVTVPFADPDALADAVAALLEDEPRRAALGAAARRLAIDRYSWADIARRLDRIYDAARGVEAVAA